MAALASSTQPVAESLSVPYLFLIGTLLVFFISVHAQPAASENKSISSATVLDTSPPLLQSGFVITHSASAAATATTTTSMSATSSAPPAPLAAEETLSCFVAPVRQHQHVAFGASRMFFYGTIEWTDASGTLTRIGVDVREKPLPATAPTEWPTTLVADWEVARAAKDGTVEYVAEWEDAASGGGGAGGRVLTVDLWFRDVNETAQYNHHAAAARAPAGTWALPPAPIVPIKVCRVCIGGDSPGRWVGAEWLPWACRYRNYKTPRLDMTALQKNDIASCLTYWRTSGNNNNTTSGLPPALLVTRNNSGTHPLSIWFTGASTMTMFAYATAIGLGTDPGPRGEQQRVKEKEARAGIPLTLTSSSIHTFIPGVVTLVTPTDGPDLILQPASTRDSFMARWTLLLAWNGFMDLDVVVVNSVLHFICNHEDGPPASVQDHKIFVEQVLRAWERRVDGHVSPPILIWRTPSKVWPMKDTGNGEANWCPFRAFPLIASYHEASMAIARAHGVRIIDQWAIMHASAYQPPDGIHIFPGVAAQDVSANVFINMLCNAEDLAY